MRASFPSARRVAAALVALSLLLPLTAHANVPTPGTRLWIAHHAGTIRNSIDEGLAVTTDAAGTRVFVGAYSSSAPGELAVLAYRARSGERLWRGTYPFADGEEIWDVEDVVATPGTVVVSVALLGEGNRLALIAFDARSGDPRWRWVHPRRNAFASGLAVGGGLVVVTGTAGPTRDVDRIVAALRVRTGDLAWRRTLRSPEGRAYASRPIVDRGRVFVTGAVETDTASGWTARTTAYALADGRHLWTDGLPRLDQAELAGISAGGRRLVVVGSRWGHGAPDRWAVATYASGSGKRSSLARLDPAYEGQAWVFAADAEASTVFVAGEGLAGGGSDQDAAVAAVDAATGAVAWTSFTDEDGGSDGVIGLAVHPTGSTVYASAYVEIDGRYVWRTFALDAVTGAERWVDLVTRGAHGSGFPRAIVIDPEGTRVFATGYTDLRRHDDVTTVADAA